MTEEERMAGRGSTVAALVAAPAVLITAAWYDTTVVERAQFIASRTFEMTTPAVAGAVGSLLIAGSILLLAVLVWRSGSAVAATTYLLVGGFFAFLVLIAIVVGPGRNDAPPLLPSSVANTLLRIWIKTTGDLGAVPTIGAGMLLAGLATLIAWARARRRTRSAATAAPSVPARPEPDPAASIG